MKYVEAKSLFKNDAYGLLTQGLGIFDGFLIYLDVITVFMFSICNVEAELSSIFF